MGTDTEFDDAFVAFSDKYADQTVAAYESFRTAIADGILPMSEEF